MRKGILIFSSTLIAKAVRMLKTTIDTEQQNVKNTMLAVTGVSIQNSFTKGEEVVLVLEAIKSRLTSPIIMVKIVFILMTMFAIDSCSGKRTANAKKYPAISGE